MSRISLNPVKFRNAVRLAIAVWSVLIVPFATSGADAALVITVGELLLDPNAPNQTRTLEVRNTGAQPVPTVGIQFNFEIAGGSANASSPKLTGVDILTGTIFESDNTGLRGGMDTVRRYEVGTLENAAEPTPMIPPGTSKVAEVTFDTSGFFVGSWELSLSTPSGPTAFVDVENGAVLPVTLEAGTARIAGNPPPTLPDPAPRLHFAEDGSTWLELTVPAEFSMETSGSLREGSWVPLSAEEFERIDPSTVRVRIEKVSAFFRIVG